MLVAFCGIDGSGKTTQLNLVKSELENVYVTKQPTDFYRNNERFMQYINCEISVSDFLLRELALLAASDKLKHYQLEVQPVVDSGIILSDRYVYSSFAYFYARGLHDIEWLKEINKYLPEPNITFCFDITPETALSRIEKRTSNCTIAEEHNINILRAAREAFIKKIWGFSKNFVIIDANRSIEEIHSDVMMILEEKIRNERHTAL